jgi:hypothetical protein
MKATYPNHQDKHNLARLTTDELLRRFTDVATRSGTVFGADKKKLERSPDRQELVQEMQALGAELRAEDPSPSYISFSSIPIPTCAAGPDRNFSRLTTTGRAPHDRPDPRSEHPGGARVA